LSECTLGSLPEGVQGIGQLLYLLLVFLWYFYENSEVTDSIIVFLIKLDHVQGLDMTFNSVRYNSCVGWLKLIRIIS